MNADGLGQTQGLSDVAPTRTLLGRAADGNDAAVSAIYSRFAPALTHWARGRLPNYARDLKDTQDLVQEALVRSLQRLEGFDSSKRGGFLRYLKTCVMNGIRKEIRRLGSRPRAVELHDQIPSNARCALDEYVDRETQDRYEAALDQLSPSDQDLVVARLELQMSFSEIAIHSGRPSPDAARMAVNRAVRKLAECMDDGEQERASR
jgi:RNA polymerase sigma-70 factor, ECF subfamily